MGVTERGSIKIPSESQLLAAVLNAVERAAEDGIEAVKQAIMTSPAAIYPAPRIDTGNMIDKVEKRIETTRGSVTLTVGWVDISEENMYFVYQEGGINRHYYWGVLIPGKTIPGMFALRDGEESAEEAIDRYLEDEFRRLFD